MPSAYGLDFTLRELATSEHRHQYAANALEKAEAAMNERKQECEKNALRGLLSGVAYATEAAAEWMVFGDEKRAEIEEAVLKLEDVMDKANAHLRLDSPSQGLDLPRMYGCIKHVHDWLCAELLRAEKAEAAATTSVAASESSADSTPTGHDIKRMTLGEVIAFEEERQRQFELIGGESSLVLMD